MVLPLKSRLPCLKSWGNLEDQNQEETNCIEVKNLWKVFGDGAEDILGSDLAKKSKQEILKETGCVIAVRDVSFEVKKGEFFVIMGLSGSGKSTLIRLLLRLIEPTAGNILVNGSDICQYDNDELINLRRHTTSMVFQNYGLLPHRTVMENVAYGLKIRGEGKKERLKRAQQAIETVSLEGWENAMPSTLSGGMQQRVGIARALANESEIMLMDEPFGGLDPLIRRQMQDELIELFEKLKKTIIFVTHDLNEALKMGSRIAIMRDGDIIQIGSPEDVITSPIDDYVRDFVQDASSAKVLTAEHVMDQPGVLLYEWQGPKAALQILKDADFDTTFLVNKQKQLLGIVTHSKLAKIIKQKGATIKDALEKETVTCRPDTIIEELFSVAANCDYPIAVTDENDKLLGEIQASAILLSMSQDNGDMAADKQEEKKAET